MLKFRFNAPSIQPFAGNTYFYSQTYVLCVATKIAYSLHNMTIGAIARFLCCTTKPNQTFPAKDFIWLKHFNVKSTDDFLLKKVSLFCLLPLKTSSGLETINLNITERLHIIETALCHPFCDLYGPRPVMEKGLKIHHQQQQRN